MPVRVQSLLWVTAQFALVALLLLESVPWHFGTVALCLALGAVVLALWVFWHNPPGNFNIRPEPRSGARLVTSGPYRRVRHPMYVALLLGTAAIVTAGSGGGLLWGLWALLGLVLNFKAALEERLLEECFPEYRDYRQHTGRFLPGLG
ncbi:MAG: isoprenylcysteine carboxylmethyltransferase family protein [Betaproteobacteria bacterium]|nr:isoprenylcysteine carboxylmethyltransferase family protein [Betaproteobacteria bacterium]MDE2212808.1 isoprenylcysteine carboxylmethyltransferase family protein [Betaproteobacteria bacterium]